MFSVEINKYFLAIALLPIIIGTNYCTALNKYSPVVLVPGDGGSQFEARLQKPSVVHRYCDKNSTWFALWLSLTETWVADCFIDNMMLQYDNKTRTSSNTPGVEIRQPGFGNTSTIEWLDQYHPWFQASFSYFYPIVDNLVKKLNYTRGLDVRGAPYDFRKAPNEMSEYINNLRELVEMTYYNNSNQKVVLLGHSMGNLYVLYMLNRQDQAWKDKYIHSFVSLGGPWAGSIKPLILFASGDSLGSRLIFNPLTIRRLQRSLPSTAYLMPSQDFWSDKETLVYGPTRNYTVNDFKQFFDDIGFPDGYLMWEDTRDLTKALKHPGVTTHCLYGAGVPTAEALVYTSNTTNWMDVQPKLIQGDGDGTVNTRSLTACQRWQGKKWKVTLQQFNNTEHVGMLSSPQVIDAVNQILMGFA